MTNSERPNRVHFVCYEYSNRSQMAEAFARMHGECGVEAESAGCCPAEAFSVKAIGSQACTARQEPWDGGAGPVSACFPGSEL